jgi:hypothetical protein
MLIENTKNQNTFLYYNNYIMSQMPMKTEEGWWLNELDSLGIKPKKMNILNDVQELGNLADNIKQTYYQDYKSWYSEDKNFGEDCRGSFK